MEQLRMAGRGDEAVQEVEVEKIEKIEIKKRTEKKNKDVDRMRRELIKSIPSNWENVIKVYKKDARAHKIRLSKLGRTALHMAVASGVEDVVEQLVKLINEMNKNPLDVLSISAGDWVHNPLHLAACLGSIPMCKSIINGGDHNHKQLLGTRNRIFATPLYMAAYNNKKHTFFWLYEMCNDPALANAYCHIGNGSNVLHFALSNGYLDLAFQIIHRLESLMDSVTNYGVSPLHELALLSQAFRSGINLSFFQNIIYSCVYVEELVLDTTFEEKKKAEILGRYFPENYQTCINFLQMTWKMIKLLGHNSNAGAQGGQGFSSRYGRCLNFFRCVLSKLVFFCFIMLGSSEMRKVKAIKQMNIWSVQIMNKLLDHAAKSENEMNIPQNDGTSEASCYSEYEIFRRGKAYETPIITAAKQGVVEMVEKILQVFPMTIHDRDGKGRNIVLAAVKNGQSHVYDLLLRRMSDVVDKDLAFRVRDKFGNTALHLATDLQNYMNTRISLLLLLWEVKWYQYVKNTLPPDFHIGENNNGESPQLIFERTHRQLLEKSKDWLSNTCNSCSFIAALISTVAFASSTSVPGGVRPNGEPIFRHHLALRFFAISSLVALYSSFISLLIFLAIHISKYHYKDFSSNLPRNLILGLTSLLVSMVAMLLCFCSGHFLMLDDPLKYAAIPVYAFTFFTATYFTLRQFPSYFVLLRAAFKETPQLLIEIL